MFYIGDHFFGTVTAHVAGEEAANYKFTSALSAQMLRALEPVLRPLIAPPPALPSSPSPAANDNAPAAPPVDQPPAPPEAAAPAPAAPAPVKKKKTEKKAPPAPAWEANEGGSSEAYGDGPPPDTSDLWNDILDKPAP